MEQNLDLKWMDLKPISTEASQEYRDKSALLLDWLNQKIVKNDDLEDLIGANSLEVMYDNHKNHIKFLNSVFKVNDFELLAQTIPWVYNTYYQRGFKYQYFLVALKLWRQAVKKYLSPKNHLEIKQVYDWMIRNHQKFIALAEEETQIGPDQAEGYQQFLESLLAGNDKAALKLAQESVKSKEELKDFYLKVIQPAMYTVGSLWQKGEISVASEHLASSITSRVVSALYSNFLELEYNKGKMILSAVANEYHELGLRMVADLLEFDGWDVNYYGVNTPQFDLIESIYQQQPFIVGLSAVLSFNLEEVIKVIERIRASERLKDTKILVGGKVFNDQPKLWQHIGADGWAKDGAEALLIARRWWQEDGNT